MNTTTPPQSYTLRLPAKHTMDWWDRCYNLEEGMAVKVTGSSKRYVTLEMNTVALCDLISDSLFYAEEMGRDNTGDIDYRPPARRVLASLERQGVRYTRRGFTITLTEGVNA